MASEHLQGQADHHREVAKQLLAEADPRFGIGPGKAIEAALHMLLAIEGRLDIIGRRMPA